MLVLDGVYVENDYGSLRFHRVNAPNIDELKVLVHAISHRVARSLEKRELLERDAETSYLALERDDDDALAQLQVHSITPHCRRASAGQESIHASDTTPR